MLLEKTYKQIADEFIGDNEFICISINLDLNW